MHKDARQEIQDILLNYKNGLNFCTVLIAGQYVLLAIILQPKHFWILRCSQLSALLILVLCDQNFRFKIKKP